MDSKTPTTSTSSTPGPDTTSSTAAPLDETAILPVIQRGEEAKEEDGDPPVVWVHRCGEMMHKIYMSSPKEIARAQILRSLDTNLLNVVFAEEDLIALILPAVERGHTLWAELTEAGRRRIASAQPIDSAAAED